MTDDTDTAAYRVWCEDCDLDEEFRDDSPPQAQVNFYGSEERAREQWSAKSAAKGKRDGHSASAFRDYDEGLRHRVTMERIE